MAKHVGKWLTSEIVEIGQVVNRLLDNLSLSISSQTGEFGINLRKQVGYVRANYMTLIRSGEFADELQACFTAAYDASVKLENLIYVHQQLIKETPVCLAASCIVQASVMFCLSIEAKMVSKIMFVSRDDVDDMMAKMKVAFDAAKEMSADSTDSICYKPLLFLAGSLTNHLFSTALLLPRVVNFVMGRSFPALKMSQRIYYTAERWDEIVLENRVVNPVFVPREIRGLSE